MFSGWLTTVVFLPLAGALLIDTIVRGDRNIRYVAGMVSLAELALTILVFIKFDLGNSAFQLVDQVENWIPI